MRVHELAKELGHPSKEVLARAQELGLEVTTASSGLDDESAEIIRLSYAPAAAPAAVAAPEKAAEAPQQAPAAATAHPAAAPAAAARVAAAAARPRRGGRGQAEEEEDDDLAPGEMRPLQVHVGITVSEFADAIRRGIGSVTRVLMEMGEMVTANSPVPPEALELLGEAFRYDLTVVGAVETVEEPEDVAFARPTFEDSAEALEPRPPVVTVMGHVDHGKTALLDTIRKTNVVAGEAGGITQHIGAYQVMHKGHPITFIDTPGHEAFTALRARGAIATDIVVLVVAADDGVMPQTQEAISHAKAAGVPVIVAVNKMDLATADPMSVRAQLTEFGLVVESLGGDVLEVEISATQGTGIEHLLEVIELAAEVEELTANPVAPASGIVIESQVEKGRGSVGTVIVQRGTLRKGDIIVAGAVTGRVRAMFDSNGSEVVEAPPSTPVLVMGWSEVPVAGDFFEVVVDEKTARAKADERNELLRARDLVVPKAEDRLQMLLDHLRTADHAEVNIIIKADAHGSLEAIRDSVNKIKREDGVVNIIHGGVGGINANDIVLAEASEGIVFGFNVRPDAGARKAAEAGAIEIRTHRIIYELLDEVEALLLGRLAPEEIEELLGVAEVRATFRSPRFGTIAGSMVTEGEIQRNAKVRLVRDGVVVYDGAVASLRRFKDDVQTVQSGFECGIGLENFRDVKEGDLLESYLVREVART
jgi:translation initiation factor IF-2